MSSNNIDTAARTARDAADATKDAAAAGAAVAKETAKSATSNAYESAAVSRDAAKGVVEQVVDLAVTLAALAMLLTVAAWAIVSSQVQRRVPAVSDGCGQVWSGASPYLHTAWAAMMRADSAVGGYLRLGLERIVDRSRELGSKKQA